VEVIVAVFIHHSSHDRRRDSTFTEILTDPTTPLSKSGVPGWDGKYGLIA